MPHREEVLAGTRDIRERGSVLREKDGFFLLPIRYWPLILFVLGIVFYCVRD